MPEHLFIVSRSHPDLFSYLAREFSREEDVQVIIDRRQADRRRLDERRALPRGDRRQSQRRCRQEVVTQIQSLGYAFVRLH